MSQLLLKVLTLQSGIRLLKLLGPNLLFLRIVLVHDRNQYRPLEALTTLISTLNLQLQILCNSFDRKQMYLMNHGLALHMLLTAEKSSTPSRLLT